MLFEMNLAVAVKPCVFDQTLPGEFTKASDSQLRSLCWKMPSRIQGDTLGDNMAHCHDNTALPSFTWARGTFATNHDDIEM